MFYPRPRLNKSQRFARSWEWVGDCWQWTGYTDKDGYGRFKVGGRYVQAHAYSWTLANGPVPEGMELDHLCRNRWCVNPDHLEAVTHAENLRRARALRPTCRYSGCPQQPGHTGEHIPAPDNF
jgi:hypothetical protein